MLKIRSFILSILFLFILSGVGWGAAGQILIEGKAGSGASLTDIPLDSDYTAADEVMVGAGVGTHGQVTLGASQFLGKKAAGAAINLTATEARAILGVADGADETGSNAPQAHKASHQNGGADEMTVVGLNGLLADDQHVLNAEVQAVSINNVKEDTTPELGGDLNLNQKSLVLDPTPTVDHTWNGIETTHTAGENLVIGDVCYLKSDGKYWKVDADAEATTKGDILMATASITAAATGVFLESGYIRDNTWAWTTGQELFCSITPGNPTATRPSGAADIVRIIGHAYNADVIKFKVDETYLEIGS